jgi:hypothetical protein
METDDLPEKPDVFDKFTDCRNGAATMGNDSPTKLPEATLSEFLESKSANVPDN